MRIARFATPAGQVRFGKVEGEAGAPIEALTVAAIKDHPFGTIEFTGERWALADVRLLAPILPSKVVGDRPELRRPRRRDGQRRLAGRAADLPQAVHRR